MAAFLMCSGESSAPTSRTPFSFLCVCVCVCLAHGPTGYLVALKLISLSLSLFPKRVCVCVCVCVWNKTIRHQGQEAFVGPHPDHDAPAQRGGEGKQHRHVERDKGAA